jgi:predicted enzyme related to lactoylglutathione lyase
MITIKLNLLTIGASDVARAVAFYRGLGLTFERERHGSGPVHHAADCDGLVFEIYPTRPGALATSSMRLGFRVPDVAASTNALLAAGGTLQTRAGPDGSDRSVVIDPEGNRVELSPSAA